MLAADNIVESTLSWWKNKTENLSWVLSVHCVLVNRKTIKFLLRVTLVTADTKAENQKIATVHCSAFSNAFESGVTWYQSFGNRCRIVQWLASIWVLDGSTDIAIIISTQQTCQKRLNYHKCTFCLRKICINTSVKMHIISIKMVKIHAKCIRSA